MISGDLMYLKGMFNHLGHQSNHPCIICRVRKENIDEIGPQRSFKEEEANFSMNGCPLFPIESTMIVPPSLHINHGVCNRIMKIIGILAPNDRLSEFLKQRHIFRDQHTKTFKGIHLVNKSEKNKII